MVALLASEVDGRIAEAQALRDAGKHEDALRVLDQVEAVARAKHDALSLGRALQKHGDLLMDALDCPHARQQYQQAHRVLAPIDAKADGQVLNDLGLWAQRCAGLAEQRRFFLQAIAVDEHAGHLEGARKAASNLGSSLFEADRPAEALVLFNKALTLATALGDEDAMLMTGANVALLELVLAEKATKVICTEFRGAELKNPHLVRARSVFAATRALAQTHGETLAGTCARLDIDHELRCEACLVP